MDKVRVHHDRAQILGSNEILFGQIARYAQAGDVVPIRRQAWCPIGDLDGHWYKMVKIL